MCEMLTTTSSFDIYSSVAYAVALGLILSLGREVTGRIPRGKVMDVEAILAGSPEAFATLAKSWMDIKK